MKRKILLFVSLLAIVACFFAWDAYSDIYGPNVQLEEDTFMLTVDQNLEWDSLRILLKPYLKETDGLERVRKLKKYSGKVKPGKYKLRNNMSNNELINMFRVSAQVTVNMVINSMRTFPELAGVLGKQLEPDSLSFLNALNNDSIREHYGFTKATYYSMFLPNTYDIYWTSTPEEVIQRFAKEFKTFWNDERKAKAAKLNLSQSEVSTIASITQEEQLEHSQEWPTIAGLYLNRIRKGMALESDPTIKFAVGDFSIKRVLNKHKDSTESNPYNTYTHAGIPPGPIRIPDISAIDAVLNAEKHAYIFMCAKKDFSGYHHFSSTLKEHNLHARAYQSELNKRRIYK